MNYFNKGICHLFMPIILVAFHTSCVKPGKGGMAEIKGYVKHHSTAIPNAVVCIKYGAKEFPGDDLSIYDEQILTTGTDASYEFTELKKGDYYLFSVGYDSTIMEPVKGGVPVLILKKAETADVNIPVAE
jgi:hypothetical protein